MGELILLSKVVKEFNGARAVDGIDLSIPEGIIFGLLGPSGSGKTTVIRLMIGVHAPTAGEVRVLGMPPSRWPARVRERVGYMPQISFLYPNLSVAENLSFAASIYGLSWFKRGPRLRELLEVVALWQERQKLVGQLSGGMRTRLSLACSLVQDPSLIFLDEPTTGIDPLLRQRFWEYFRKLRDEGKTLLVTSHYVGEAEHCDHVGILNEGRLVAAGPPVDLRRDALGGDAVDITTQTLSPETLRVARQVEGVSRVVPTSLTSMRVYVNEAATAVPRLADALHDKGLHAEAISEYHPSFDEVFARLVEKAA